MRRGILFMTAAAALLALSGCGERAQTGEYKQGKYQGKEDTPPWASAPFGGDRAKWENQVRERGMNQHEYRRTGS